MSNIDKQAVKAVADLKAGYTLGHADVAILNELARIALESLEAESVAFRSKLKPPSSIGSEHWDYTDHRQPDAFELESCVIERLYTAPPAPVSDSLMSELLAIAKKAADAADECAHAEWSDDSMEHSTAIADWERRAAMLQGADGNAQAHFRSRPAQSSLSPEQGGNSPVIPDGWVAVPVEPTEDMIVNGFESEPDESFSDEKEWEVYEAMSGCQQAAHRAKLCWAAMISAAPKI